MGPSLDQARLIKALKFKSHNAAKGFAWTEALPTNQIHLKVMSMGQHLIQIPVSLPVR